MVVLLSVIEPYYKIPANYIKLFEKATVFYKEGRYPSFETELPHKDTISQQLEQAKIKAQEKTRLLK